MKAKASIPLFFNMFAMSQSSEKFKAQRGLISLNVVLNQCVLYDKAYLDIT